MPASTTKPARTAGKSGKTESTDSDAAASGNATVAIDKTAVKASVRSGARSKVVKTEKSDASEKTKNTKAASASGSLKKEKSASTTKISKKTASGSAPSAAKAAKPKSTATSKAAAKGTVSSAKAIPSDTKNAHPSQASSSQPDRADRYVKEAAVSRNTKHETVDFESKASAPSQAKESCAVTASARPASHAPKDKSPAGPKASATSTPPAEPVIPVASTASVPSADMLDQDKNILIKPPIIVKDLAVRLGCKPFQLIHELMEFNIFATLNQAIEEEHARKICEKRGFTLNIERRGEKPAIEQKTAEQTLAERASKAEKKLAHQPQTELKTRPPVVTFMGHVDHGKTSLLDAIRQARVAAGEAGGITQHIGAYTVKHKGQSITFLDTPGHEAFTAMRARGANVTDIAVIVCAADDGVMPQTLEAIQHAKAAKVAIMVAINKIDTPGAKPDRVRQQMQDHGLVAEEWGGHTIFCEVSATQKIGIDKLIEMILLQAEILELKGQSSGPAIGSIIESQLEQGRGPTATVLVRRGTLRVGDAFVCGEHMGKVKALVNDRGESISEAGLSQPAKVIGFSGAPLPGEEFTVVASEKEARQITEERAQALRLGKLTTTSAAPGAEASAPVTLENLFASLKEGQKKTLRLVIKADVQGSLEAIVDSLKKIKSQKIDVDFALTGVGPISVNDVLLARASNAIVLGFNTKTDNAAAAAAKREGVQIKLFSIIYELIDQVREAMVGMLDPETRETQIGTALVKKVFELSKFPVAGCIVQTGRLSKSGRARVVRKRQPIYDGAIVTLKRFQDEANEVRAGMECGVRLGNFNEYMPDDIIECYMLEKVPQSL